jgi:signal transduction histidine kinase/ligand-binding sensor domain-containing protein
MNRHALPLLILFSVILSVGTALCAQPRELRIGDIQFSVQQWNVDNGLPQNTVRSLLQTSDGYIWFGTFGGLVRFDGVSFTVFNSVNTPKMISDRILALAEDHDHRLWIGMEGGGLMSYFRGAFTTYEHPAELKKTSILKIFVDAAGAVWVWAQPDIILCFSGSEIPVIRTIPGLQKGPGLLRSNDGRIYASTNDECFLFSADSIRSVLVPEALYPDLAIAPYWDRNGNVWSCRKGGVLSRRSPSGTLQFTSDEGLLSTYVRSIYQDREGAVWIGSDGGLNMFDGGSLHRFTTDDGLSGNEIISILEDNEGNLWLGTKTSGLMRLQKKVFTTHRRTSTDAINNVTSVFGAKDGSILYGVNCAGVNVITEDGSVTNRIPIEKLENGCIWSVFVDSKNTLWLGTWGGGVLRYPQWDPAKGINGIVRRFPQVTAEVVLSMMESRDGTMWFGTFNNGLFRYRNDSIVRIAMNDGKTSFDVRCISEQRNGMIRIGTEKGLYTLSNAHAAVCLHEDSVPDIMIRALYEDQDSVLWVGSYGKGLIRLKNGRAVSFRKDHGLYDDLVSHILEDGSGWLWMGCNKGIFSVNKQQLNRIANGADEEIISTSFSTADGMVNRETNGGFQPSAFKSADGRLWFPTVNGVASVHPDDVKRNSEMPPVVIEEIAVDRQARPLDSAVTVSDAERILEFHYTALTFSAPEKTRFKYMLKGYDKTWNDAEYKREAAYMNLPPGSYHFSVIAANNHGVWNMTGAGIAVTVLPPFWKSIWFLSIAGFMIIFAGPAFYLWRVKLLKQKAKEQEDFSRQLIASQEHERKKIAGEIHDSLSQNILLIKHRAHMAIEQSGNAEKVIGQLNEISVLAGETLEDTRKMSHELRPSHLDRLGLTLTFNHLLDTVSNATTLRIEREINPVDDLLEKDDEIMAYRIVQELINNVLKHAGANTLTVIIGVEEQYFRIFVQDDGKGFDQEITRTLKSAGGLGLAGITERIHLLNGSYTMRSRPGEGTTMNILIPLQKKVL